MSRSRRSLRMPSRRWTIRRARTSNGCCNVGWAKRPRPPKRPRAKAEACPLVTGASGDGGHGYAFAHPTSLRKHLVERHVVGSIDELRMMLAQALHHHPGIDLEDLPAPVDRDDVDGGKADADGARRLDGKSYAGFSCGAIVQEDR